MGHQLLCNQWVLCGAPSQLSVCLSFNRESTLISQSTNQSINQSVSWLIIDTSARKRAADEMINLASEAASQAGTTWSLFGRPCRSHCKLAVWLASLLPCLAFPALLTFPLLQVPDWHPGVPASNQEIFSQDSWQVNMGSFFSKLVTTYPGVVGKLILDLVNVSHSALSACPSYPLAIWSHARKANEDPYPHARAVL